MRILPKTMVAVCCVAAAMASIAIPLWAQDEAPVAAIQKFSDFEKLDTARLAAGETLSQRGSLMNFANGISVQTCFVVEASPEKTAEKIPVWDPTPHEPMKVYGFGVLHNPCVAEDFCGLRLDPQKRPVRWLMDKTVATTAGRSELYLSRQDARDLAEARGGRTDAEAITASWTKLLLARATTFQRSGLKNLPPYETGREIVSPAVQLRLLLGEQAAVARKFEPVLRDAGLHNGHGDAGNATPSKPVHYWSLFEADHRATMELGAVYRRAVGNHYQLLDEQYFVSNGYHVGATLYEVWPWRVGDKTVSLVWRGDYIAAPVLSYTKGTERLAYGVLMLQDVKQEIRFFQQDMKGK